VGLGLLVSDANGGAPPLSSRDQRAARRALTVDLEAHGVEEAGSAADLMVGMGITSLAAEHRAVLASRSRNDLLEAAAGIASFGRAAGNIREAARRMSRIVFALKSYAGPGDQDTYVHGTLSAHLDTVLTLYGHKLRSGLQVVRDYAEEGVIEGMHDRLDQLWTNLVHNAVQAMGSTGTLTLRIRRSDDAHIAVTIGDDGPGIPDEVRARIFEPFFSTKAKGEGCGLGLSICKDIVDAHRGTIAVESRPGDTTFLVRLPIKAPAQATS
jgi:signal transduction histidine kinase